VYVKTVLVTFDEFELGRFWFQFGETPDRQQLNFVVCKKEDTTYKLVVLFAEGPPTAKTIRL
jgi:hypothetical protein